MFPIGQFVSII